MQAFKYHSVVKENGTIEIPKLPLKKGQKRLKSLSFQKTRRLLNLWRLLRAV